VLSVDIISVCHLDTKRRSQISCRPNQMVSARLMYRLQVSYDITEVVCSVLTRRVISGF